ncbi:MAG: hypothetical protein ABI771_08290 [Betaproteobacteria bacterium]
MKKLSISSTTRRSLLALSTLAGLSACGGGGGDGSSAPASGADTTSVPASAVASNAAFVRYLDTMPATETQEPLGADAVTLPTTDSEEPTNV